MKKNILFLLTSLLLFKAADVKAQEECTEDLCFVNGTDFYARILGGVNFLQNTTLNGNKATYQAGYIISGSLGYSWCYGLCLEFEYAFRRNAISKVHFFNGEASRNGHVEASSYMANLVWNLPLSDWGCMLSNIQPFVGAGVGYDFHRMHSTNSRIVFNQRWKQVSWQVMTGLAFPIFCNAEMTLEYKFHRGSRHFYNQSVGVGFAYKFGFLR